MRSILMILCILGFSFYGCGGDSSTSPDDTADTPLATGTIGPTGGSLETEGFVLAVPAGAFDSDADLKLFESSEDHGFGENCVSRFFRLEGLPEEFSDSLTVKIGYEGTVGEDVMIAVGATAEFYDTDLEAHEDFAYELQAATERSGFIEAVIPGTDTTLRSDFPDHIKATGSREVNLAALNDVVADTSEHFIYSYPKSVQQHGDEIVRWMEAAHDSIAAVGIGFDRKTWKWPGKVTVKRVKDGKVAAFGASERTGLEIEANVDFVTEATMPRLRTRLGESLTICAQSVPDLKEACKPDNVVWNVAVYCWLNEKFCKPGEFVRPLNLPGNEIYALEGLPANLSSGPFGDYGAGWSVVVKYLTGRYGYSMIGDVYTAMQTAGAKPAGELLEQIPDPTYNWWPSLVDGYLTGKIYGVESAILLSKIESGDKDTIAGKADTAGFFNRYAEQLSARMYRIILDYSLISPDAVMELRLETPDINEDYSSLLVYKTKDGVMTYLGSGDVFVVGGLRDLTLSGYDIIAAEVMSYAEHPFTEKPYARVEYHITGSPPFQSCLIRCGFDAIFQTEGEDKPDTSYLRPGWRAIGSFSGNTFRGQIDQGHHGENTTGSVSVTIDPLSGEAVACSTSAVTTDAWGVSRWGMTFTGLPASQYVPGEVLEHLVEGPTACSYIRSYSWSYEPSGGNRTDVVGRICGASAGLEVTFYLW